MRMNSTRMHKVAAYAKKHGVTKAAKDLLKFEGNGRVDYSFKGKLEICKRAVIKAVKWSKADNLRKQIKAEMSVFSEVSRIINS